MAAGANILKRLRPQAPEYSTFDPAGPPGIPVAVGGSGPHPRYEGTAQYSPSAMRQYSAAQSDYDIAMKDMREDAMEHIRDWSTDFPKAETAGQLVKAPPLLSPVDRLAGKAPVNEMALYNQPQEWPGISSITNLRKKRRTA